MATKTKNSSASLAKVKVTPIQLKAAVKKLEAMRRDTREPIDISLADYAKKAWGTSMASAYKSLGISPTSTTIQNIINMPDQAMRWIIPEIYRDALRLGLRKSPIYPNIISGEQSVSQTSVTMPAINMSEATPHKVGIAETITTGSVSFDQKTVNISKYGRGFKIPYEVVQYVSLNLVSIFLQDFGIKLAMGLDSLMIKTLINGDQANGSDSITTLGVKTPNTLTYRDLLKIWVRLGRLGRGATNIIAGEDMAIELLELFYSTRYQGTQRTNVNIKSPIPTSSNVWVHGSVPSNSAIIVDDSSSIIKLNAQPLLVESDKIISNQVQEVYATLTTGFATIFRDARALLDMSKDFATHGFPTWMNPSAHENVTFE